ncbi:MAG: hypothetical protein NTY48_01685 [Candidatus Diapherotrites archaeon]|nr:hypothetical protein [Candidatus Diapherotrites archaeon]
MINDFIEVNKLNARVIEYPSDSTIEHALHDAHLSIHAAAKAIPFFNEKTDLFVIVIPFDEKISTKEASKLFKETLTQASETKVLNLTGFEKDYLPPIAVFGAKVLIHKNAKTHGTLIFSLSPREYLVITKEDIEKSAELNEPLI